MRGAEYRSPLENVNVTRFWYKYVYVYRCNNNKQAELPFIGRIEGYFMEFYTETKIIHYPFLSSFTLLLCTVWEYEGASFVFCMSNDRTDV